MPAMTLLREIRRRARHIMVPILGALMVGYFGYHAVTGDRGLITWFQLTREIEQARVTLDRTSAERQLLDHRVSLLRPDNLDPDMLDERARAMLNLIHADEFVILDGRPPAR